MALYKQIPSHLILNDNQKEELKSLPVNLFVHINWTNDSQKDAFQFLKSHNLLLESLEQDSKWKT